MHLQLIILESKISSEGARGVWQDVCQTRGLDLEVIDASGDEGRKLTESLTLSTFPALILDGKIKAIGIPDKQIAGKVLDDILSNPDKDQVAEEK
ncbi:MAG: hypothetical protein OEW89_05005 [Gammaproteobacteria bacterium]|nr:hypothetical protein [Gammaproteobacteria bacterium]MDH5592887.1 hypothetical protein [Gammaproteobacteria bacterium]MDH5614389.1 hypothetical protein [Gammaproteobacteria bacterium]